MVSRNSLQIKEVKTFLIEGVGSGGDYHNVCRFVKPMVYLMLSNVG